MLTSKGSYSCRCKVIYITCPKNQEEEEDMSCVPYASVIGRLMYAMVCPRSYIAHGGSFEQVYVKTKKGALDNY